MLAVRNHQQSGSKEQCVSDQTEEQLVVSFLEKHPDFTVVHGPLYRVVDGQVVKGVHHTAWVYRHGDEPQSFEGTGKSLRDALRSVAVQMKSTWGDRSIKAF